MPFKVNIGKWILRYLFSSVINEEIRRDDELRSTMVSKKMHTESSRGDNRHPRLHIPLPDLHNWRQDLGTSSASTPRPGLGNARLLMTPGLAIGAATPGATLGTPGERDASPTDQLPGEPFSPYAAPSTPTAQVRKSSEAQGDYFSRPSQYQETAQHTDIPPEKDETTSDTDQKPDNNSTSSEDGEKSESSKESSTFSKRLRSTFSPKKSIKLQGPTETAKQEASEDRSETPEADATEVSKAKGALGNTLIAILHQFRETYTDHLNRIGNPPKSLISPSLPVETPVLSLPLQTAVVIQEQRPDSVGVADLFESNIGDLGKNVELFERTAPSWLGEILLLVSHLRLYVLSDVDWG